MRLVMVGGHTRNIGKTSVIEGLISGLPEFSWTAVKITQFGHDVCSIDGQSCECAVAEHQFSITEERERASGTDTARFLAAGARRSLWVRTRQGELVTALSALKKEIEGCESVIIESNSLRKFIQPTLYLQVLDPANDDFKLSAQQFFDFADAYLIVTPGTGDAGFAHQTGPHAVLLAREIERNKSCFAISPNERFMDRRVIDFVRGRLGPLAAGHSERAD